MVSIMPGMENLAPERTETSRGFSGLSLQLLQALERGQHLDVDLRVQLSAHVLATGLDLDGESRRHRQAGVGHLGQASAFAAQHILHAAIALGLASAEEVRVLGWGRGCACILLHKRLFHHALLHQ
jgi:hypothetical protein